MNAPVNNAPDRTSRSFEFLLIRNAIFHNVKHEGVSISKVALKATIRAIHDHASPVCTASCTTLGRESGLNPRTIRRCLSYLSQTGVIEVHSRFGYVSAITINWDRLKDMVHNELMTTQTKGIATTEGISTTEGHSNTTEGHSNTTEGHSNTTAREMPYEANKPTKPSKPRRMKPPTLQEVKSFWNQNGLNGNPERYFFNRDGKGWANIERWESDARYWSAGELSNTSANIHRQANYSNHNAGVNHDPTGGRKVVKL